jgi:Ser/Thr protein kinase RdoA (MazF antagonist)
VKSWIALVGDVYPNLAPALSAALGVLERRLPVVGVTRASLVHRDFYDKQVLIGAAAIGLLDLDTACLGDGEIDVANFCAHLALRALQSHTAIDAFLPLQQQFVQAYRGLRPTTNMRLVSWYLASALLRLACIYALRPRWHTLAPRLIEESSRVLNAKDER